MDTPKRTDIIANIPNSRTFAFTAKLGITAPDYNCFVNGIVNPFLYNIHRSSPYQLCQKLWIRRGEFPLVYCSAQV